MKTRHTLLSGETIDFHAPAADLAAFLRRVLAATKDAAISERELTDLVFGPENPLLDSGVVPGKTVVTVDVYRDPIFHVMLDCIARKRLGPGGSAVPSRARYTMTVAEAAGQLGISESAVRQAVYANRLRARKDGGAYYIDPLSVAAYRVSRRGPPRRRGVAPQTSTGGTLEARVGSGTGVSFRVKHLEAKGHGPEWAGTIAAGWSRIAVLATSKDRTIYWELEPGDGESVLALDGFYIRVIDAISSAPKARAAFLAFEAS